MKVKFGIVLIGLVMLTGCGTSTSSTSSTRQSIYTANLYSSCIEDLMKHNNENVSLTYEQMVEVCSLYLK